MMGLMVCPLLATFILHCGHCSRHTPAGRLCRRPEPTVCPSGGGPDTVPPQKHPGLCLSYRPMGPSSGFASISAAWRTENMGSVRPGRAYRPRLRPTLSFMISVVPPKIDWTRLSPQSSQSWRSAADWCSRWSRRAPSGQREPRRSPGAIWAAITRQGIVSPRRNFPSRGVAPTTTPNQRPRISQPSIRTSSPVLSHHGTAARGPRDARCQRQQPGEAVLPRAAARQSVPQPGSGRSPPQHGHVRRSMATMAGRGTLPWDGNRVGHVIGGRRPASAENVAYHAYSAGHEQTARQVRRHRPSRQGRRPFPRPGGLRGRSQPDSVAGERKRPQRAHGRGDHLRCRRRRARPARGGCRRLAVVAGALNAEDRVRSPQPVSGRCPRSCGSSKNTVCRSCRSSWCTRPGRVPCRGRARPPPGPAGRGTASSSPAPCQATAGDRTDRIQACSRTEKRASKRSCPDQLPRVNDHRDVHG